MRVAIVLALAVGLCGCGGPPEGVCPATSAAPSGQLVIRSGTRMYTTAERLDCAPLAPGSTSLFCNNNAVAGVSYTITVEWPARKLVSVQVFDSNGATEAFFLNAQGNGTSSVVTSTASDVPNRRELTVTGLLCDGTTDPGVYVGADLNRFRILLPTGL